MEPTLKNITENNLQLKENSAVINFLYNIGIPLDILETQVNRKLLI
jgi:hypothetical protein